MKFYLIAALAVLLSADVVVAKKDGKKAFDLTNDFRKKSGKTQLKWSDDLYSQAMKHNLDMAKKGKISHDGFGGRFTAVKGKGFKGLAENVGSNSAKVYDAKMVD